MRRAVLHEPGSAIEERLHPIDMTVFKGTGFLIRPSERDAILAEFCLVMVRLSKAEHLVVDRNLTSESELAFDSLESRRPLGHRVPICEDGQDDIMGRIDLDGCVYLEMGR